MPGVAAQYPSGARGLPEEALPANRAEYFPDLPRVGERPRDWLAGTRVGDERRCRIRAEGLEFGHFRPQQNLVEAAVAGNPEDEALLPAVREERRRGAHVG